MISEPQALKLVGLVPGPENWVGPCGHSSPIHIYAWGIASGPQVYSSPSILPNRENSVYAVPESASFRLLPRL